MEIDNLLWFEVVYFTTDREFWAMFSHPGLSVSHFRARGVTIEGKKETSIEKARGYAR
jgi:hypothetical protein